MLDELRDQMATYLSQHQVCVLSTAGSQGAWAMPVRYRLLPGSFSRRGLEVDCLVPRWADVAYHLEQNPKVLLIIQDMQAEGLRWLEYRGTARPVTVPDWAGLLPGPVSTALAIVLLAQVLLTREPCGGHLAATQGQACRQPFVRFDEVVARDR